MTTPTKNTEGFVTVESTDPLRPYPRPDPTAWAIWMEDFVDYDKTQGNAKYTLTQTNGVDTIVGPTGVLTLTLGGADNDLAQLYLTDAAYQLTAGKKALFEAKVKVDKATGTIGQEELFFGLSSVETGTSFFDADGIVRTMQDAIGFLSYDGSADLDCVQGEATVFSTTDGEATYADVTWMVLTIYYDGAQSKFYKDGALVTTLATNEPTSVLTPMLYVKAGEAKAKVLSCDYVFVAFER